MKNAYIPHTPYIWATAFYFPCITLNPNTHPSSLPWERVRERATSRKACIRAVKVLERLLQFGECPLPSPPPRGREQVSADSSVEDRLKKNARNINSRNFSGSLYRDRWNKRRKSFFRRPLNPSGRVCAARHAYGGLGLQGKWRTRAYRTHPTYRLIACYLNTLEEKRIWTSFHLKFAKPLHITFTV